MSSGGQSAIKLSAMKPMSAAKKMLLLGGYLPPYGIMKMKDKEGRQGRRKRYGQYTAMAVPILRPIIMGVVFCGCVSS